jgi:hypothetical protein
MTAESPEEIRGLMAGRLSIDPAGWLRLDLRLDISPDGSQILFCGEPMSDVEALSRFGRIVGQLHAEQIRRQAGQPGLIPATFLRGNLDKYMADIPAVNVTATARDLDGPVL